MARRLYAELSNGAFTKEAYVDDRGHSCIMRFNLTLPELGIQLQFGRTTEAVNQGGLYVKGRKLTCEPKPTGKGMKTQSPLMGQ
jgi:hypothetical protein